LKTASNDAIFNVERFAMRTTVTINDELLAKAERYFGKKEKSQLVNEALLTMIQLEASRRLAKMGGSQPGIKAAPRRRSKLA
jgi:Arc/MetJ family transcription regulator